MIRLELTSVLPIKNEWKYCKIRFNFLSEKQKEQFVTACKNITGQEPYISEYNGVFGSNMFVGNNEVVNNIIATFEPEFIDKNGGFWTCKRAIVDVVFTVGKNENYTNCNVNCKSIMLNKFVESTFVPNTGNELEIPSEYSFDNEELPF